MDKFVLIGLDGSGKSTNLDKMKQDPQFRDFSFVWVRWEPKFLKPIYRLVRRRKKAQADTNQDERAATAIQYEKTAQLKKRIFSNRLVGRAWLAAALADYWPQFKRKYAALKKSGKNIVFDRFYYDLFIDQGINIGLSAEQIANLIDKYGFLFPSVNLVIYIRTKPETCFARKDDIAHVEYLQRRYEIYELLSSRYGWTIVDGEKPLETVYAGITSAILHNQGIDPGK